MKMSRTKKTLLACATIVAALSTSLAAPQVAHAATNLGGVSVARYCAVNVPSGNPWVSSQAVNINNKWDGWRCATTNGSLVTVNMNLACTQQYPKTWWWQANAWANHFDNGPYSWRCYR